DSPDAAAPTGVCAPSSTQICTPAPSTPLYAFPASEVEIGKKFHQPKFGGDGWLGPENALHERFARARGAGRSHSMASLLRGPPHDGRLLRLRFAFFGYRPLSLD